MTPKIRVNSDLGGQIIRKDDLVAYLKAYYKRHQQLEENGGDDTTGMMTVNHIMDAIGEDFIK